MKRGQPLCLQSHQLELLCHLFTAHKEHIDHNNWRFPIIHLIYHPSSPGGKPQVLTYNNQTLYNPSVTNEGDKETNLTKTLRPEIQGWIQNFRSYFGSRYVYFNFQINYIPNVQPKSQNMISPLVNIYQDAVPLKSDKKRQEVSRSDKK